MSTGPPLFGFWAAWALDPVLDLLPGRVTLNGIRGGLFLGPIMERRVKGRDRPMCVVRSVECAVRSV